jgi:hypothetical protein
MILTEFMSNGSLDHFLKVRIESVLFIEEYYWSRRTMFNVSIYLLMVLEKRRWVYSYPVV